MATDVRLATPVVREVAEYEEFTGRTDAFRSVQVLSRVTGYLEKRLFREGGDVKEGDPLYEIDNRPYQAALDLARANVARGEAHRRRLEADHKRASNLFQRGAIGRAAFDVVISDLAEAEAMLNAARARLEQADLNFSFTLIKAPMSGQISRSLVEPGNLVRQEFTVLTDIVDTEKLYVYFDLNPDVVSRVLGLIEEGRVGSVDGKQVRVEVGLSDEEGYSYKNALVNFSENKLDAATGTLRIRGTLDNPKSSILSPGLFVKVRLPIGSPHPALLIPEDAVGSDQGRAFVFVVGSGDEVAYRPVEVGQSYNGLRAVLKGLSGNERIVTEGLQKVRAGSKVAPEPPKPAKTQARPAEPAAKDASR